MSSRGFWIGMIIGTAVGVGVGMLYAPGPGHESRRKIKDAARATGSRVADVASSVQKKARETVSSIRPSM